MAADWDHDHQLHAQAEAEREKFRQSNERKPVNGYDDGDSAMLPPLVAIDPATLEGHPAPVRQWLVQDWVPIARATSLYGAGGEGKTLLAQMLATACAIGCQWLGMPVRQCNSLLFFAEDDLDEMHRRQTDVNAYYKCNFNDLGAMRWLPRLGDDNVLMTFENGRAWRAPIFDQILDLANKHNAGLIIIDTLADVFNGNENDRAQARLFVQSVLARLAREVNGAVIALAHPSLAGVASGQGGSGSTGWIGAFRSHLYLSTPKLDEGEPPDPNARVLSRVKSNFAARSQAIELRWEAGVFVAEQAPTGIVASIERQRCERVFLSLLDATTREQQPVSCNSRSGNYAPRLFAKRRKDEREGFKAPDFEHAMQALFARRPPVILNVLYGRNSDQRYRIARAPDDTGEAA